MIEFGILNVLIFVYLKAIMDLTVHKDYFKKWGYSKFFWKETAEGTKTTWFHKYFPMFYDIWHLSTFLQVCQICLLLAIPCHNPYCFPVFLIFGGLTFNFLYDQAK